MKSVKVLFGAVVAVLATVSASAARADVIGPDEMACQGRSAGATCITAAGGGGTCETRTLPVGAPDSGGSRTTLICTASAGTDAAVGAENAPAGGGCRCAAVGIAECGGSEVTAAVVACALASASVFRRRRRCD